VPGVYKWTTAVTIPTDVTLSGGPADVWILQIAGTLDLSAATQVILSGGAQARNIFWQVAGQTTLGPDSKFKGILLDATGIAMGNGATLDGRALAQTAVTLIGNTVDSSGLVAGWDFSQYDNDPLSLSIDGGTTLTNTLAANYSDLDPTSGAGFDSAAFGTMFMNGLFGSTLVGRGQWH
jgi:hypothetical protein